MHFVYNAKREAGTDHEIMTILYKLDMSAHVQKKEDEPVVLISLINIYCYKL